MSDTSGPVRCVAVLGPSSSGVAALVDAMAALEGGKPPADSHQNSIAVRRFPYLGERWAALGCPEAIDLLQIASDALQVADAAVVSVPADPEQAVLAAPFIRLADSAGVPFLLFVNRQEQSRARLRETVAALQHFCNHPLVLRQVPVREGDEIVGAIDLLSERAWRYRPGGARSDLVAIPEELIEREQEARSELLETLADFDDDLLEQIVEDKLPPSDALYTLCRKLMAGGVTVPVFFGTAEAGNGVNRLMKALRHEAPSLDQTLDRLGVRPLLGVFYARHQKHLGKVSYLRAFSGKLTPGMAVAGGKLGQLAAADDPKAAAVDTVAQGDVAKAVKTDQLEAGTFYDSAGPLKPSQPAPVLAPQASVTIAPASQRDEVRLTEALAGIAADDRALAVSHDEEGGHLLLSGQGDLHFRQIVETLRADFGLEVEIGDPKPRYMETIAKPADIHYRHKKQTGGSGQFADIQFKISPTARGEGFRFEETIRGGSVPRQFIPAVETGMREGLKRGPHGFPVTDLAVTLYDGKHHAVDSSDMAFKIAGQMGIKEAFETAGAVLLEPIYDVRFEIPDQFTGAINPRISSLHGQMLGFERDPAHEGWEIVRALMPGKAMPSLLGELRAATQGTGRFTAQFAHYQELYGREAEAVLAQG